MLWKTITILLITIKSHLAIAVLEVKFEDMPCIKPYADYKYLTCNAVKVQVVDEAFVKPIEIPKEFKTDLASIPRLAWTFVPPNYSPFIAPSILHDYLYTCHNGMSRKEVDTIYYNALLNNGVSQMTSSMFYYAVRLFGNLHYHSELKC